MGHGGDGKTSLVESLLNISGATDRVGKIADGNTVCDFDPEEIRRKFSISTAVAPVEWNDCKINLLDTPGFFDFESEVQISAALSRSRFRSRFRLGLKDRQYICDRGWETMRRHAAELVEERLAPAFIPNDGKQTPMRGHPVFIAQHATACCCRGCLEKWHKIPSGRALTAAEQEYIVGMLLFWMQREMTSPLPGSRR